MPASVGPDGVPSGLDCQPPTPPEPGIPSSPTSPENSPDLHARIRTLEQALAESERREKHAHARFVQLSSLMSEAVVLVDGRGHVQFSNDRVSAYSGLSARELIYEYGQRYHAFPEGEAPLVRSQMPLARALRGETSLGGELTLQTASHEVVLRASSAPVRDADGEVSGALLVFEDVSRRTRAERRNELIQEVSELLSQALPSEQVLPKLAEMVGEVMGAWSVLALATPGEDALEFVGAWHPDPGLCGELLHIAQELRILQSVDPGMGWVARTGRPILKSEIPTLETLPGLDPVVVRLFERLGSASLLIVPLKTRQVTLGAMMLVSIPGRRRFREEDLEFCTWLVERIAARLDGARLLESLRSGERRMRLLAQLSRQFSSSLELAQVLRSVTTRLTEALGDGCVVGILNDEGDELIHHIRYHRNPALQARMDQSASPGALHAQAADVCRSLIPVLYPDLRLMDPPELLLRLQSELGLQEPTSYACLPILARGRAFGFVELFCEAASQRRLLEQDLELLGELALRASDALQHAMLYEELHALMRAKDDWLSVASHELKTPLTPLQVMLQLMERKVKRGETIQIEQIERSINQVRALITLINDLLDISQFELGAVTLEIVPLDMAGIVTAAIHQVASTTLEHRIRFTDACPGVKVLADPARLEQALSHLLTNAIRYSPQGGDVLVSLEEQTLKGEPCVVLSIQDHGIGVPRAEQHRLFQRYFRGSNVSERNYGGLGLGLWMAREIVVRLHGHIWAESQEGAGSCFSIALPALQEGTHSESARPCVLLVGEPHTLLAELKSRLAGEGLELLQAGSCPDALRLSARKLPLILVVDLALPYLEVLELLQRCRRLAGSAQVAVLLTGTSSSQVTMSRELNATDFLVKPVDAGALAERILALRTGLEPQARRG